MSSSSITYTLHEFGTAEEGRTQLVYGIDERFIRGAAVCIASAAYNSTQGICAHIIYGQQEVSAEVARILSSLTEDFDGLNIRLYAIEDFANQLMVTTSLTSAMYYRYSIGEILHGVVSRAIYLDADIIVDCNIDSLFTLDMQGYPLGAVENYVADEDISDAERMKPYYEGRYFNSGVLLIDVERWHAKNVLGKAIDKTLAVGSALKHYDQDVLNIIFANNWQLLERRWNFISYPQEPQPNVVAHFIGSTKPWMAWCDQQKAQLYDRYEAMTCFSQVAKAMPRPGKAKEAKHYKRSLWRRKKFAAALWWELIYFKYRFIKK